MTSAAGQSNNIPWPNMRRKIWAMLETFDEQAVADMARISLGDVRRAAKERPPGQRWTAVNTKTGATVTGNSERAAYRAVMVAGWTEWDWQQ